MKCVVVSSFVVVVAGFVAGFVAVAAVRVAGTVVVDFFVAVRVSVAV